MAILGLKAYRVGLGLTPMYTLVRVNADVFQSQYYPLNLISKGFITGLRLEVLDFCKTKLILAAIHILREHIFQIIQSISTFPLI